MEVYNFFTELVSNEDQDKKNDLNNVYDELLDTFDNSAILMVPFTGFDNKQKWSIMGQIHGEDTNVGDTNLLSIFGSAKIKYTWINANDPTDNNIPNE